MRIERLAAIFLMFVCLAHVARLIFHVEILIGGITIPFWVSGIAFLVTGGLAMLLWRESER